jgi:EpsI family protein
LAYEGSISERLEPVLGADDYLVRGYRNSEGETAELFTAYYLVQYAGESMHSPKNCLGGAGWEPIQKGSLSLINGTAGHSSLVNSFVIEKDGQRFVMLYWYQIHGRMIASEYWLKAYLVWDAVCNRRRDGALVRITVPIRPGSDGARELNTALDLARTSVLALPRFLPV